MRAFLAFVVFAWSLASPARATDRSADVAAIQAVVEQFKAAIIAHDGTPLGSLFLQDHDSWLSVADDVQWTKVKARNPQASKVRPSATGVRATGVRSDIATRPQRCPKIDSGSP